MNPSSLKAFALMALIAFTSGVLALEPNPNNLRSTNIKKSFATSLAPDEPQQNLHALSHVERRDATVPVPGFNPQPDPPGFNPQPDPPGFNPQPDPPGSHGG